MSFTAKLGTSSSRLESIKLATAGIIAGGGNVSVALSATASTSVLVDYVFTAQLGIYRSEPEFISPGYGSVRASSHDDAIGISATSQFAIGPNLVINAAQTLSAIDSFDVILGFVLGNAITISATGTVATDQTFTVPTISLSVTASIILADALVAAGTVTLSTTDGVTVAVIGSYNPSKVASATSSATAVGNQVYESLIQFLGVSSTVLAPGIGWQNTLTIDATASANADGIVLKFDSLTLSATDSLDGTAQAIWNTSEIIVASASVSTVYTGDQQAAMVTDAISTIYVEGLYDFLLMPAGISVLAPSFTNLVSTENPGSVGSVGVAAQGVFNRTVVQTLTIGQVAHSSPRPQSVTQTLTVSQSAVRQNVIFRAIVHSLAFNQVLYRLQTASNTLTISAQVTTTYVHVRTPAQTFAMHQAATKTSTISRSASNTLVMRQGFNIPLPFNTLSGQLQASIPAAYVAVISDRCYMTLGVAARTIVLPCPRLGDTQNYSGTLTLQRSMTGETTTYVRRSRLNKLKYTWWLGRNKAREFEDFVLNFSAEIITLYNWKGETWLANIVTNPVDFSAKERYQPDGERYEVSIEFEGVKIGG